jgi:hypothetical protein
MSILSPYFTPTVQKIDSIQNIRSISKVPDNPSAL